MKQTWLRLISNLRTRSLKLKQAHTEKDKNFDTKVEFHLKHQRYFCYKLFYYR